MSAADDLRDLRDALDSIAHGALPRWGRPTTKTGEEASRAAMEVYEKFVRALHHESAAQFAGAKSQVETDDHRAHAEALTARCEAAERKRDEARAETGVLRGIGCREQKVDEPESGPCGACLRCAEEQGAKWALEIALDPSRWPVSAWTPEEVCRDAREKRGDGWGTR